MSKTCHYHHHHLHFRSWHSGCVGQALISAQPLLERRPRGASDCKTLQCLLPHSIPPLSLFSLYPHPNWQMLQMISNLYDNNNKDTPRTHFGLNQVKPSYAGNSRHAQLANLFVRNCTTDNCNLFSTHPHRRVHYFLRMHQSWQACS